MLSYSKGKHGYCLERIHVVQCNHEGVNIKGKTCYLTRTQTSYVNSKGKHGYRLDRIHIVQCKHEGANIKGKTCYGVPKPAAQGREGNTDESDIQ